MKKAFLFYAVLFSMSIQAQDRPNVSINLPTGATPRAAFDVYGTAWIDTIPSCSNPQYVLALEAHDSVLKKIRIDSLAMLLQSYVIQPPIIRTYTSNATWTKPPGLKYIIVEMVGGGGGGGGCYNYGGGAGAAGGYCKKIIPASLATSVVSITIGIGGSGGPPQFPGGDGGTSSFGSFCSATGGEGGKAQTTLVNSTNGSFGGIGYGGDINLSGASSGGAVGSSQPLYCGAVSHFGGGSPSVANQVSSNGIAAITYGSGGSGGNGYSTANQSGGTGSSGYAVVTEYY